VTKMTENVQFHDIEETAEILEVSTRTVRRYIKNDELQSYKIGNKIKVRPEDLDEFIESRKQ